MSLRLARSTLLRRATSAAAPAAAHALSTHDDTLVYASPFASPVKMLKRVSITTAALTTVGLGMCAVLPTSVPAFGKAAIAGTAASFGYGSTGLLTLLVHPYVLEMTADAGEGDKCRLTATTLSLLGGEQVHEFALGEVVPTPDAVHPFATFSTGEGTSLFIHANAFADKAILERLLGRELKEGEGDGAAAEEGAGAGDEKR